MMHRLALLLLLSACAATHAAPPRHAATIPAEHTEAAARNAALVERARGSHAPLIFLGDSITEGWEVAGKAPWAEGLEWQTQPFDGMWPRTRGSHPRMTSSRAANESPSAS